MDFLEEVGESSSPPRSVGSVGVGGCGSCPGGNDAIRNEVFSRLMQNGNKEATSNPDFSEQLQAHFNRLPPSYVLDINMDRVEDVLLHQKLLARARDPDNQPVFHIRFLENACTKDDDSDTESVPDPVSLSHGSISEAVQASSVRDGNRQGDFETKLEDLNLDVRKDGNDQKSESPAEDNSAEALNRLPIHEIIFSTVDKPKLLSQLSALLSDIGLNIREAHVFSTTDGFSLDVFVVDGWDAEDTQGLNDAVNEAIAKSQGTWSCSSRSPLALEKAIATETRTGWEIDWSMLKIEEKIASGSCGDLFRGEYLGKDVAVKVLRSENLNKSQESEFSQEVSILSQIKHGNVVRFIGADLKLPRMCMVTEYMAGGNLYEYLKKNHHNLTLSQLLKFAIDVCEGMEYLHKNSIIHRDLKTSNLLLDASNVVKVADFGIARFQNKGGVMTAETGTYRWMAPEVMNHQYYDHKADVFSFAIVLWELLTAKVPYYGMSPLQAAMGVRQGLRPELPENVHPKLAALMRRCWEDVPTSRPTFTEIKMELEELWHEVEVRNKECSLSHLALLF